MITEKINSTGREKCTGCHACATSCPVTCIDMKTDKEGFWYPEVTDACIHCGKCIKSCHIFNKKEVEREPVAYACYHLDEEVRMQSSSGGIFHPLAQDTLAKGGLVFGACFNERLEVVHDYIEDMADVGKFQGSKYVQSKIGNSYGLVQSFLKQGREVLFSGTPCQIGGLKSFLNKEYYNLTCVDFICHGVPSPMVWSKYLSYQNAKHGSKAQKAYFRAKDVGWEKFSMKLIFENSSTYIKQLLDDVYMEAFLKDISLRPSCYDCDFKNLNRQSDITIADFWGIDKEFPEMNDDRGISLIFVNSIKGTGIFDDMKSEICYMGANIYKAISHNSSAVMSVKPHAKRVAFFKEIAEKPFDKVVKRYCTLSFSVRLKRKIKRTAGATLDKLGLKDAVKSILKR